MMRHKVISFDQGILRCVIGEGREQIHYYRFQVACKRLLFVTYKEPEKIVLLTFSMSETVTLEFTSMQIMTDFEVFVSRQLNNHYQ